MAQSFPTLEIGPLSHSLEAAVISIGRADDNVVVLDDASVSGHHAEIEQTENGLVLRDLGSTNGTKVNDLPVTEAVLKDGDAICFGSVFATVTMGSHPIGGRIGANGRNCANQLEARKQVQRSLSKPLGLALLGASILSVAAWWLLTGHRVQKSYEDDSPNQVQKDQLREPESKDEVANDFLQRANEGHADAQYRLGVCYLMGKGVPKDMYEAAKWWRKAATQNHAGSLYNLGVCFMVGEGVPKDQLEGVKLIRRAAEANDAGAQYYLGKLYELGEGGMFRLPFEAMAWYKKAAQQGHDKAQSSLGLLYYIGEVEPKNLVLFYKWASLAAAQGNKAAKFNLNSSIKEMTADQIEEGEKLVREFKLQAADLKGQGNQASAQQMGASSSSTQPTGTGENEIAGGSLEQRLSSDTPVSERYVTKWVGTVAGATPLGARNVSFGSSRSELGQPTEDAYYFFQSDELIGVTKRWSMEGQTFDTLWESVMPNFTHGNVLEKRKYKASGIEFTETWMGFKDAIVILVGNKKTQDAWRPPPDGIQAHVIGIDYIREGLEAQINTLLTSTFSVLHGSNASGVEVSIQGAKTVITRTLPTAKPADPWRASRRKEGRVSSEVEWEASGIANAENDLRQRIIADSLVKQLNAKKLEPFRDAETGAYGLKLQDGTQVDVPSAEQVIITKPPTF